MTRPTLIDVAKVSDGIVQEVGRGLTYRDAAEKHGITDRTLRNWMRRGREEDDRLRENPKARERQKEIPFRSFYLRMEKAKAEAKGKVMSGWYKSATETTKIVETTIFQIVDVVTGDVKQESRKIVEREVPPDWRAQQALMQGRYGMIPTSRIVMNLEDMTDEELERIAAGEDPFDILQERLQATSNSPS